MSFLLKEWKHFDWNDKNFPLLERPRINNRMQGELVVTKEEIVMLFLDTVKEFAPEKLEEYIAEIKKNSLS